MSVKIDERMLLSRLQLLEEIPSPLRRKLKVVQNRLPEDFFTDQDSPVRSSKRSDLQTQAHNRDFERLADYKPSVMIRKESMTARVRNDRASENREMDLILSVISTSREMKRVLRKHSVQFKKESCRLDHYKLQLPPLLLKKGHSTPI